MKFDSGNHRLLADHFVDQSRSSDFRHVSWLNRNISKNRMKTDDLSVSLTNFYHISGGIGKWIINDFVRRFRGDNPHPFILAMQQYDPEVIRGYVVEHHHFLKQWIRSCSYVMAKTELEDVQSYELENIMTELHGYGDSEPSHHELLIRMGESLGLDRNSIISEKPLWQTAEAVKIWNDLAASGSWISTMAAMHSLELIANRDLSRYGARYPYFNPSILSDSRVPKEVKAFLREGYEADVSHSYVALDLVERHAGNGDVEEIQYAYLRSAGAFSDYLEARLERGVMLGNK
ncbi:MAG: iron-containing redox enzyme family protein [Candidatus Thermoplasmatota archaeon]|nr:iron-containing redox enzyme family protein [Candidatus Thermoplasmatota archaeon]